MSITPTRAAASTRWLVAAALLGSACSDLVPIGNPGVIPDGSTVQTPPSDATLLERILSPEARDVLGRTCTSNDDCSLLQCVKPTDSSMGGGGPAHGYCSTPCANADDAICKAANGKCLNFAPGGTPAQNWCVQTCQRGGNAPDMNKCRGRDDVACTASSVQNGEPSGDGYCLPTCNGDDDCGARHCDPSSGVCVDAISGDPTGTACAVPVAADGGVDASDTDASNDESEGGPADDAAASVVPAARSANCAGVCLSVGAATHVCAQRCSYGSATACHLPPGPIDGGTGAYSACLFVSKNTGPGDEAHCGQLCDSDGDCLDQQDPGVTCNKSDEAMKAFGHGYCDWVEPGDASSPESSDAAEGGD
jgi:hypothetical protein